jgi:hypothetical protein
MDLPRRDFDRRLPSGWRPQRWEASADAASAPDCATRRLLVDDEVVCLESDQLDGLLDALAKARETNAEAVRDEIGALRLIPGAIRLFPTSGELTALRVALAAVSRRPIEQTDPASGVPVGRRRVTGSWPPVPRGPRA